VSLVFFGAMVTLGLDDQWMDSAKPAYKKGVTEPGIDVAYNTLA
jgi:hypothetical protein